MKHLLFILTVVITVVGLSEESRAQFAGAGTYGGSGYGARSASSAILSRPTVSPYLALTDLTGSGQIDTSRNYFTQVRPRLDNLADQRQAQQAMISIQRNVSSLRSAVARQSQGQARATGHPTRFSMYMHYYPGLSPR